MKSINLEIQNKTIQKLLGQENTAQELTVEEVLEFTDNKLKWLADEYKKADASKGDFLKLDTKDLYSLMVRIKQLRDKLKEISK